MAHGPAGIPVNEGGGGADAAPALAGEKTWSVGTLIYTRRGLIAVFIWMLWGDLVFTLTDKVFPAAMPFQLKRLGIPQGYITMMMGTLTQIIYMPMNPILSTLSDRYRSKWGRRIPYIAKTMLPLSICFAVLGFSDQIGEYLTTAQWLKQWGLGSMATVIVVLSALILIFDFFNVFINTIFWYLFADVIPRPLMGRFVSLFRIVSMGAGSLFGFFVQRYIEIQTAYVYLGAAVLYLGGFTLVCTMMKEGGYPPPEPIATNDPWYIRVREVIKVYIKECFRHPVFIWFYAANATLRLADAATIGGTMSFFFRQYLHISQGQIGAFDGFSSWCFMAIAFPLGWVADKIHPMRSLLIALVCMVPLSFSGMFMDSFAFYILFFALRAPFQQLQFASEIPLHVRLFPRKQYGQFASANGMVRSGTMIVGTMIGGAFIQFFESRMGPRADGFCFLWMAIFQAVASACLLVCYLYWKKNGADRFVFDPEKRESSSEPAAAAV